MCCLCCWPGADRSPRHPITAVDHPVPLPVSSPPFPLLLPACTAACYLCPPPLASRRSSLPVSSSSCGQGQRSSRSTPSCWGATCETRRWHWRRRCHGGGVAAVACCVVGARTHHALPPPSPLPTALSPPPLPDAPPACSALACSACSSFFQSVCVLGYCIFPLVVACVLCFAWSNGLWRLAVAATGLVWSTRGESESGCSG